MLCIGVAMVASLANYHVLLSIHRPLGIAILILVVVRFVNRLLNPPPPLPTTMSRAERLAATASEYAMYKIGLVSVIRPRAPTRPSARAATLRDDSRQSEKVAMPRPSIKSSQSSRNTLGFRTTSTNGDTMSQSPNAKLKHIKYFNVSTS